MYFAINRMTVLRLSYLILVLMLSGCGGAESGDSSSPANNDGKGGSMSRFTLVGDYLYAISGRKMHLFNLADSPATPTVFANIDINWNIETLYSANNYLFIGAQDGVYIFNNDDPSAPYQVSKFLHVAACDPVVAHGQYAYVTLHSRGSRCGQGVDRLDVLDLADITNPKLVKSYPMQSPKGLGVGGGMLYVCDDAAGLKSYDLTEPAAPQFVHADTNLNCYDLIPDNNKLVVSDNEGIVQLDTTIAQLGTLSRISLETP